MWLKKYFGFLTDFHLVNEHLIHMKFAEHNPCKSEVSSRFQIPSEITLVVEHRRNVQLSETHHPLQTLHNMHLNLCFLYSFIVPSWHYTYISIGLLIKLCLRLVYVVPNQNIVLVMCYGGFLSCYKQFFTCPSSFCHCYRQ